MGQFWMITLYYYNQLKHLLLKSSKRKKIVGVCCWLLDYILTKPMVVDEALESFKNLIKKLYNKRDTSFQLKEWNSALKKFAIQYRIDGKDWIDTVLFLDNAKQSITSHLINRRQTKCKLILLSMMEKVDLKSGEVVAKEAAFHSKTEINLESTDSNELF